MFVLSCCIVLTSLLSFIIKDSSNTLTWPAKIFSINCLVVAFSSFSVFDSEYKVFKLSIIFFFMLKYLKPVVCGKDTGGQAGGVGCGGSIEEGRKAVSHQCSGLHSQIYPLWELEPTKGSPANGPHQVCLLGGTLRLGTGINHKSSRDGCSLGHCHGVAENRVAECKFLGFA